MQDVQEALSVSPNVPIVECDARGRASTKATLIALVEHAIATIKRNSEPSAEALAP